MSKAFYLPPLLYHDSINHSPPQNITHLIASVLLASLHLYSSRLSHGFHRLQTLECGTALEGVVIPAGVS